MDIMKLREINQTEQRISQNESKKILSDMIVKLEGGYCSVVGRKKDYQKLGTELLEEWGKLSDFYPYVSPLLTELKEKLEKKTLEGLREKELERKTQREQDNLLNILFKD